MRRRAETLTIKPAVLKNLLANEAVDSVLLQGVEGGFHILIGFGAEEKPLGLARGDRERLFKTIAAADRYLIDIGIEAYAVDRSGYSPPAKPTRRSKGPGQVAARERAREAADYTAEARASIEQALAQVDAGTVEIIPWTPGYGKRILAEIRAKAATDRRRVR